MAAHVIPSGQRLTEVNVEAVKRVLEVGNLLFPLLTSEEIDQLQAVIENDAHEDQHIGLELVHEPNSIGNDGVT